MKHPLHVTVEAGFVQMMNSISCLSVKYLILAFALKGRPEGCMSPRQIGNTEFSVQ
jgi:hypothetical protein